MSKRIYDRNDYAAGRPTYGAISSSPHAGTMLDPLGYKTRDRLAKVRRNAVLRRMKAQNTKNYSTSDWLRDKG